MENISTSIQYLKGVGEKRAQLYEKLEIHTVRDLLYHFPRTYVDYTSPTPVMETELNAHAVIEACVTKKMPEQNIRRGLSVYKAILNDGESDFTVVFYNNRYAFDALKVDETYLLYGRVTGGFLRREMNSPTVLPADTPERIQPVYSLTEGLTAGIVHANVKQALKLVGETLYDFLPDDIRAENGLCALHYALENIHFPEDERALELAKKRLAFDELLTLQLGMLLLKGRNRALTGFSMQAVPMEDYYTALPFSPTNAQKRAIAEITGDMCAEIPMNRLLQGDVGSGKTAVAAAACYFAYRNGCQSALMAPTEILADQHFHTLNAFLEPLGVNVCLLKGSLTPKQKALLKEKIQRGEFAVVVGTHALVQQSTEFRQLGLVITDEQHRFGVEQRARLAEKGANPHKLVMSATPIPRTLGLIVYGDLDISVLDELPKGRIPIETYAVTGKVRGRAFGFIEKELAAGRQGYIVCPMIEDSDSEAQNLQAVKSYAKNLEKGAFSGYKLGLLHGKMPAADKEKVMSAFKAGKIQLLVSTTVVEVGVDVPNATVILIENADRFGLSQLHQLRGRVGRGTHKSTCILVTDNVTPEVRERMRILSTISDGFKLSEEDMRLRGCGDFFGERQHGLPPLKIAELDSETLRQTQTAAKKIIARDPTLSESEKLKEAVGRLFEKSGENAMN